MRAGGKRVGVVGIEEFGCRENSHIWTWAAAPAWARLWPSRPAIPPSLAIPAVRGMGRGERFEVPRKNSPIRACAAAFSAPTPSRPYAPPRKLVGMPQQEEALVPVALLWPPAGAGVSGHAMGKNKVEGTQP